MSVNAAGSGAGNAVSGSLGDPWYGDEYAFLPNGEQLVFASRASDLVPNDANGKPDVFVRDLATGATTLLSTNAAGIASGDGASWAPVVSPDGAKVAFESSADDLGPVDGNFRDDVYIRDLSTGTTSLVSVNAGGTSGGNLPSDSPIFSPDSTKVLFSSYASNLGPTDTNTCLGGTCRDLYLRDLSGHTTSLVSVNAAGVDSGNEHSIRGAFSPDGTKVAFESGATNLGPHDSTASFSGEDIYIRDLATQVTSLATTNLGHTDSANGESDLGKYSADGSKLLFTSLASNLVADDTNGFYDAFTYDTTTGAISLVSRSSSGPGGANGNAHAADISADGQRVAFTSEASNLGPADVNSKSDLYVRDLSTGTTVLVSTKWNGSDGGDYETQGGRFSPDGTRIVFQSQASNFGPNDTNTNTRCFIDINVWRPCYDVYERKLPDGPTTLVSSNATRNDSANDDSGGPVYSPDGTRIAFSSEASNLGPTDANGVWDIYLAGAAPSS